MKSVLVIGAGKFGLRIVEKLAETGNEVVVADRSMSALQEASAYAAYIAQGDASDRMFLERLGVANFDVCIVAIGKDIQSSLMATSFLKDMGAAHVIARAVEGTHARILMRNGADEIVEPEREIADSLVMHLNSERLLGCLDVDDECQVSRFTIPESWHGKRLMQIDAFKKKKVDFLAIRHMGVLNRSLNGDVLLYAFDEAVVFGKTREISKMLSGR